jgi:hypothetical protein
MRSRAEKMRRLVAALNVGYTDIEAGKTQPLTDALLRQILARGRQRAAKERNSCPEI